MSHRPPSHALSEDCNL